MTEPSTSSSLLKGTENLPEAVFIYKMLKSRAKEIQTLENTLAQPTGTKLVFQRLPKHMRRRTMSHKVKRLPRRLREAHLNQMKKSGLPPKQKRPSRKFKRRPKNLLQDYMRRQRKHTWLETHIWHAKRFHMIERWGYRLPDRPCDKAFRACYRASAKHCLLQDISYISCLELTGAEEILSEHLKLLTNQCTGLTINARAFKSGNREGSAVFFHKDSYPFKAIGEVKFMWKPEQKETTNRQLWLWIHAAFYSELVNCLSELFNLQKVESNNTGNPCYHGTNGVKMTELKHSLNRFRLTGPLSHSVVKKSLKFVSEENKSTWLTEYLQLPENKQIFNEQTSFWNALENISTSSQLSPYLIMNLVVSDPRYNLPTKRTKALLVNSENEEMQNVPQSVKYGSIWSEDIRTEVSKNKMSTSELLSQRRNKLVADNIAPLDASAIPLMLIQQPGNRNSTNNLGYCSGWDIISPSNWGRPLWLSLIMWGGRAGGIRESHMLKFEQTQPDFLHPDTKAGETEDNRVSHVYKEKFFNLPPNKRVNYTKMGIVSPFTFAWKMLIGEWNLQPKPMQEFYVLRDRKKIQSLQEILKNKNVDFQNVAINFTDNCLVPVALTLLKRGRMKKFSIICLPEDCDFKNKNEPVEPLHKDENQAVRKDLRDAHQKLLKRLRKRRIRAKETGKELPSNDNLIEEQAAKMKSLWLPEPKAIRNSCARQIFGFVTNGDFSYTIGQGKCIGYVAVGALPTLFNRKQRNLVLLRDTSSRQYRLANIEIICT